MSANCGTVVCPHLNNWVKMCVIGCVSLLSKKKIIHGYSMWLHPLFPLFED